MTWTKGKLEMFAPGYALYLVYVNKQPRRWARKTEHQPGGHGVNGMSKCSWLSLALIFYLSNHVNFTRSQEKISEGSSYSF